MGNFLRSVLAESFLLAVFATASLVSLGYAQGGPDNHPKMTKEQHTLMRACLEAKGIEPQSPEERASGKHPEISDEQRAIFKTCRKQVLGPPESKN